MKLILKILFVGLFLSCTPTAEPVDLIGTQQPFWGMEQVKVLQMAFVECQLESSVDVDKAYFYAFPADFKSFEYAFGFAETDSGLVLSTLYYESMDYVNLFFNLNNIPVNQKSERMILLAVGGTWQADGVNYFQNGLRAFAKDNSQALLSLLEKESDETIYAFWRFYFDGPHVSKEELSIFNNNQELDERINEIMTEAFDEVRREWND